jgi:2-oxo-3-hexenedioate decarboxylase
MNVAANAAINVEQAAQYLDDAAREVRAVEQMSIRTPFSVDEAYRIQRASIERRKARGERPIGVKLGFTSRAKMIQMGVDSLIWGWLTDTMLEEEGAPVELGQYIHPRVEPEVCFLTKRDIDGPVTALEAHSYLEALAPAMEIIDSRYEAFRFTLEDVIADNCSSAGVVVGAWSRRLDGLRNAGVLMRFDGRDVQVGSTGAILGDPLRSIVQASRLVTDASIVLPAGSLIMAGAATAAQALTPDLHVQCVLNGIGQAEFSTRRQG